MTMPTARPGELTIIVPTRNERSNVRSLLSELGATLPAPATVLFVDDSDDDTPAVIAAEADAGHDRLDVRLLHRPPAERTGGLGGAVMAGLALVTSTWVCVMDGDLQHPPECVGRLLSRAIEDGADLVVASRYVRGGRNEGLSPARTAVSLSFTALAKLVFPGRLRGIRDPMSGFFLFRREALTEPMAPRGFKVLLEIAARHPRLVRREVPFVFVERTADVSKGTLSEGLRYLRLLVELRLGLGVRNRERAVLDRADATVGTSPAAPVGSLPASSGSAG